MVCLTSLEAGFLPLSDLLNILFLTGRCRLGLQQEGDSQRTAGRAAHAQYYNTGVIRIIRYLIASLLKGAIT